MNKKLLITIIASVLLILTLADGQAQTFFKIKKADFLKEEAGFKEAYDQVKNGDKYFRLGTGAYKLALEYYLRAKNYDEYNPGLNYKIGVAYLYSDEKWNASKYLEMAYEFNPQVTEDIHLMLGKAYQQSMMFDKAIESYRKFDGSLDEKKRKKLDVDINKLITECESGKEIVQDTLLVDIVNIGSVVNSAADDYGSVFSASEARMYFTTRRPFTNKSRRNAADFKFNEDVYVTYFDNNQWERVEDAGKPINSKGNDAALFMSPDDTKLYLYYGKKKGGNIYASEFIKGKWTSPSSVGGVINSKYKETTLAYNDEMNEIFFVSNDKKMSLGGKDIFHLTKDEKGKWKKPVNLGNAINTPFDEEAVHLNSTGDTLFFSSNGHNSMGGFDVFRSVKKNGTWSKAENLGYPLNTPEDELFYVTTRDTAVAYYSTIRKNGLGWKDIFKVTYLPPPVVDTVPEIVEEPEPLVDTVIVVVRDTVTIVEEAVVPVDTSFVLLGTVLEEETSNPVMAKLELIDMDKNNIIATSISSRDNGGYRVKLEDRKDYGIEITAEGYMLYLDIVDIPDDPDRKEIIQNFFLKKIKVGETVILKNIFFEFNRSTLTTDSYSELNRVLKLLTTNPTMTIEVSGHTDNIGSLQANTRLSESRAKAVVDYLVGNGINASRLQFKGYAFLQPITTNDTEAGRAQNRRVEFKILSK